MPRHTGSAPSSASVSKSPAKEIGYEVSECIFFYRRSRLSDGDVWVRRANGRCLLQQGTKPMMTQCSIDDVKPVDDELDKLYKEMETRLRESRRMSRNWSRPRGTTTPPRRTRATPTPRIGGIFLLLVPARWLRSPASGLEGDRAQYQRLCLGHRRRRSEAWRPCPFGCDHRAAALRPRLELYPARPAVGPRGAAYL